MPLTRLVNILLSLLRLKRLKKCSDTVSLLTMFLNFIKILTSYFISLHFCYNFCLFYGQSPNIRSARKSFDGSGGGGGGGGDSIKEKADKDDRKIIVSENEQGSPISQANLNNSGDIDKASGDNCNSTNLPDIINVQPVLNCATVSGADNSITASLVSNLKGLKIESPKGGKNTLTVPNLGPCEVQSVVSSDDEVFSECQTYSGPQSIHDNEVNHSIQWDNVVSSVTSGQIDSLENTIEEHVSTTLLYDQHDLSADSTYPSTTTVPSGGCIVDAIIDSNLNASNPEITTTDTTRNLNQSQESNTSNTILDKTIRIDSCIPSTNDIPQTTPTNNEHKLNTTKILDGNTEKIISNNNHSLNETPLPLNQTFNDSTQSGHQKSESIPANNIIIPEILNSTLNVSGGKNMADLVLGSSINLNGTFDIRNAHTYTDPMNKIKQDKCLENEMKALTNNGIIRRNSIEPMDVDCYSPEISHKINEDKGIKKNLSPIKTTSKACDVFVENFVTDNIDVMFKTPTLSGPLLNKRRSQNQQEPSCDEDFQQNELILNPSDFDFLLSKGNTNVTVDRNSLLLRFDPLLGHPVPVSQELKGNNSLLGLNTTEKPSTNELRLSPAIEEDDSQQENEFIHDQFVFESSTSLNSTAPKTSESLTSEQSFQSAHTYVYSKEVIPEFDNHKVSAYFDKNPKLLKDKINQNQPEDNKNNDKMSVDVIQDMKVDNDVKLIDSINTKTDEKQDYKMAELEKKIKNEVLKTEDIEKKFKDAEQREEALLKRITEKDKAIAKMSGVVEAYEKAIAELIADKEQIIQNYEAQLEELKKDRDVNYQHLTSLEATFSDLHAKYERSKQITSTLKSSQEDLISERNKNLEDLRLQEQRYDKMKSHAMQQLEIANNKLESLSKNHAQETAKLKALLKKEEISRLSMAEQLQQKSRENEELVKICDELINGQGS